MSLLNNLRKIAYTLRERHEQEIIETGDWSWNLKDWTINFITEPDYESITAYRAKDGRTDWSEYIVLQSRKKVWEKTA